MPSIFIQQVPSTTMWKGIVLEGAWEAACDAPFAMSASDGAASVSHSPIGMKQNCTAPVSRIVRSRSDSTSSAGRPAPKRPGVPINSFDDPAKDLAAPGS